MVIIALAQVLYLNPCNLKFAIITSSAPSLTDHKMLKKKQYFMKRTHKFNINNFCKYLPL